MRLERNQLSLQPTALVNEAYIRLVHQPQRSWENRAHFLAVAALLMRQILVDHARRKLTVKRGAGYVIVSLDDPVVQATANTIPDSMCSEDIIAIDPALTALAALDPRRSPILELRFFGGMNSREIAAALNLSERTVDRESALARKWLAARLRPGT